MRVNVIARPAEGPPMLLVSMETVAGNAYRTASSSDTPSHDRLAPCTPAQFGSPSPDGTDAVVSFNDVGAPHERTPLPEMWARSRPKVTTTPGASECTAAITPHDDVTTLSLTVTILSATLTPAALAGDGAITAVMRAPVAVAGTFQPSARKAATSAACFESL